MCLHRRAGHPVTDDVVVDLLVDRNLHELNSAVPPVPARLYPVARARLEARFAVLVVIEVAVTLDEAEALRILVDEAADAQLLGIRQRPPQPLSGAGLGHQAVAVVHLGTKIIEMSSGMIFT